MPLDTKAAVEKAVQKELAKVPSGHSRGLLRISGSSEGEVELRLAQRLGDHWSVGGVLDVEKGRKPTWGAEVLISW